MINSKPLVSVILPTYNRARLLPRAIDSVLNQTYKNLELIIIDDGSTDNTDEIVSRYQASDSRVRYLKNSRNSGAPVSRNRGIKAAEGEYIAFQDSDDEWTLPKLRVTLKAFTIHDADVVYSQYKIVGSNTVLPCFNKQVSKRIYPIILKSNFISLPTATVKKVVFKDNMFDTKLPRLQEWDLWIRLRNKKFVFIEKPLVNSSLTENSISTDKAALRQAVNIFISKYLSTISTYKELKYFYLGMIKLLFYNNEFGRCMLLIIYFPYFFIKRLFQGNMDD